MQAQVGVDKIIISNLQLDFLKENFFSDYEANIWPLANKSIKKACLYLDLSSLTENLLLKIFTELLRIVCDNAFISFNLLNYKQNFNSYFDFTNVQSFSEKLNELKSDSAKHDYYEILKNFNYLDNYFAYKVENLRKEFKTLSFIVNSQNIINLPLLIHTSATDFYPFISNDHIEKQSLFNNNADYRYCFDNFLVNLINKYQVRYNEKGQDLTFLDVGAFHGWESILVSSYFPNIKVQAFEPNNEAFKVLDANLKLNDLTNKILAFPVALLHQVGLGQLFISSIQSRSSLVHGDAFIIGAQQCMQVSLDEFYKDSSLDKLPFFVNIDVEGLELNVLQGGAKLFEKGWRPIISLKYFPVLLNAQAKGAFLEIFIRKNNYRILVINRLTGESLKVDVGVLKILASTITATSNFLDLCLIPDTLYIM